MTRRWLRALTSASAIAAAVVSASALALSMETVQPLAPGPYAVGCSDVAQDFSRVPAGATAQDYWEGIPDGNGNSRYVTALFSESSSTIVAPVTLSGDGELFGDFAGQTVDNAVIVCYPTDASNPRPDYLLPTGRVVPHMQRAGDLPLFASNAPTYPVLLFSHGLLGSPLSNDYITALAVFASYGYVVLAPFHGDPRIANVQLSNFSDVFYAITHFRDYTAMQAVRPVELEAALNAVLARPEYSAHLNTDAIGGFGASLGGESMLLMAGAQLTDSVGMSSKQVMYDARLKAAVGYVPYFGQIIYPAFGRDHNGLNNVTIPFLGIGGTSDTTAPLSVTIQGMQHLTKTRQLVALQGVGHMFDVASSGDIFTWSVIFLNANVVGDPLARVASARMQQVAGGGDDVLLIDYTAPTPPVNDEQIVIEYYNGALGHYFMTDDPAEAAMLDAGVIVPGWARTGFEFKAYQVNAPVGVSVCRFFGTPGIGPNSHFYTTFIDGECQKVMANPDWTFEGIAFAADAAAAGDCAADRIPVVRLYNNGMGGQANHRYLTSRSEMQNMVDRGWIAEGPVFCGLP